MATPERNPRRALQPREPERPASATHDSWLEEKCANGWSYGPVKDEGKKEHPCYVSYDELPKEQQAKDHLFKGIVAALSPLWGGHNTVDAR
jgi:RyR domain